MLLTLPVLLALAAAPGGPAQQGKTFPFPYKVTTLKNGLTVVRVPFESPGLVAYTTVVRVGSRNEVEEGHTGFAHFFEHMMFRGTKRFPEGSRGQLLGKLGFSENAFTTDDITVYYLNGPASALETLIDTEADRFANLDYTEPAFQTEAESIRGEYQKNISNPGLKIEETNLGLVFTKHTYRHTTIGFFDDILQMPKKFEYSKTFFKRWYTPDNTLVVLVGDFDDAKALALIEKHYGSWTGKADKLTPPVEPPQKQAREGQLTWTSPTTPRLGLSWRTPAASPRTPDAAIQEVLVSYLVGPTSPLYRSLVLEQQLVERIGSFYEHHRDPCLFGIDARLKAEANRDATKAAILAAIKDVADGKVDARRLDDIKSHLRYRLLMDLETPNQVAQTIAMNYGIFGTTDATDTLGAQLAKVNGKDLTAFVKKHLVDANRTTLNFTVEVKP